MSRTNRVMHCQGPAEMVKNEWIFMQPPMVEDIYDAREYWESGNTSKSEEILNTVLKKYPDHLDGLMVLGCLKIEQGEEAIGIALLAEAVHQGEQAIPEEFDTGRGKIEWGFVENRSYLRACWNLAEIRVKHDAKDEARKLWKRLVRLSPGDELEAQVELEKHAE